MARLQIAVSVVDTNLRMRKSALISVELLAAQRLGAPFYPSFG